MVTSKIKPLVTAMATCFAFTAYAATITVDTATDLGGSSNCTLRKAIKAANTNAAVGSCSAGTAADTIIFAAGLNNQTITLNGTQINITDTAALTIDASTLADGITFSGNNASRVFGVTENQTLTLNNLTITQGRTTADSSIGIVDCDISTTPIFTTGGAICTEGDLVLIDSAINNSGTVGAYAHGGGFFAIGTTTLTNSTISSNSTAGSSANGGGFFSRYLPTLTNSTVLGNSTTGSFANGGGFFTYRSPALTNSIVSGNSTVGSSARGGGVYAYGGTITNSTIFGNSTAGDFSRGGGVYVTGTFTLTNSTVSGNSTTGPQADGGGIYAYGNGNVTLTNSTVGQNQARHTTARGDGMFISYYTEVLTLNSTILSGNGMDNFASNSYSGNRITVNATRSLFGDGETEITSSGPIGGTGGTSTDNVFDNMPELISLTDNGCAVMAGVSALAVCVPTHKPSTESPAVDAGAVNGQGDDQRGSGFIRVINGKADIGAFERTAVLPPNPFGECDGVTGINTQDVTCTINKVLNPGVL